MERPMKRPRLSATLDTEGDVAISGDWDLQAARTNNDMRLKSIFEGIFSKYGQDFTDVGDEIDLQSGKIVVDNGHLLGMTEEPDTGNTEDTDSESENAQGPFAEFQATDTEADSGAGEKQLNYEHDSGDDELKPTVYWVPSDTESDTPDPEYTEATHLQKPPKVFPVPTDPLWQAPDLPPIFSTPVERKYHVTPRLPILDREVSPPGSGSLWTLPRRGRPRTKGTQATPSKYRAQVKREYHSSPVVQDRKFTQTSDGDESDDPLQEAQVTSTPLKIWNIRGRRLHQSDYEPTTPISRGHRNLPSSQSATVAKAARNSHSEASDAEDVAAAPLQYNSSPKVKVKAEEDADAEAEPHSHVILQPVPKPSPTPLATSRPMEEKSAKSYLGLSPDESKMAILMRFVHGNTIKEIHQVLPYYKRKCQVVVWFENHCHKRRDNPPRLSAPWSEAELETLDWIGDQSGLSWEAIRELLKGRSRNEIEYELIRVWLGEEVWNRNFLGGEEISPKSSYDADSEQDENEQDENEQDENEQNENEN